MFCFSALHPRRKPKDELEVGLENIDWLRVSVTYRRSVCDRLLQSCWKRAAMGGCKHGPNSRCVLGRCVGMMTDFSLTSAVFRRGNVPCLVTKSSKSGIFSLLTRHGEISSGNRDIPPQILKWRLVLLSKVKLIHSSQPTGCCLVHISWSSAEVSASVSIKKILFYSSSRLHKLKGCSS